MLRFVGRSYAWFGSIVWDALNRAPGRREGAEPVAPLLGDGWRAAHPQLAATLGRA